MSAEAVIAIVAMIVTVLISGIGSAVFVAVKFGYFTKAMESLKEDMGVMEKKHDLDIASIKESFRAEKEAAIAQHCKDVDVIMTRIAEDKDHDDKRIQELYESRNETNSNLRDIMKDVQYMVKSMDELKDALKERK